MKVADRREALDRLDRIAAVIHEQTSRIGLSSRTSKAYKDIFREAKEVNRILTMEICVDAPVFAVGQKVRPVAELKDQTGESKAVPPWHIGQISEVQDGGRLIVDFGSFGLYGVDAWEIEVVPEDKQPEEDTNESVQLGPEGTKPRSRRRRAE